MTTAPIEYSCNLPCVQLQVDGHSVYFLLDTGSFATLLDENYCLKQHWQLAEATHSIEGIGGSSNLHLIKSPFTLSVNGTALQLSPLYSLRLTPLIQSIKACSGITIVGIVGANLLHSYQVVIDGTQKTLQVR